MSPQCFQHWALFFCALVYPGALNSVWYKVRGQGVDNAEPMVEWTGDFFSDQSLAELIACGCVMHIGTEPDEVCWS